LIAHSETVNAMLEQKVKSVRALERGLDVLLEIQSRRAVSLHELHQSLKLPKATLLRMLVTLASKGLVWQRLADGAYLPHVDAIALNRFDMAERIAEIASPHMDTLSYMVAWPSVLAVPRLDHVAIIETNSPKFRLDSATLGPVGLKLSYLHTATQAAPILPLVTKASGMRSSPAFAHLRQATTAKHRCASSSIKRRRRVFRCASQFMIGLIAASRWSCGTAGGQWASPSWPKANPSPQSTSRGLPNTKPMRM
jgi:hypothetical protein